MPSYLFIENTQIDIQKNPCHIHVIYVISMSHIHLSIFKWMSFSAWILSWILHGSAGKKSCGSPSWDVIWVNHGQVWPPSGFNSRWCLSDWRQATQSSGCTKSTRYPHQYRRRSPAHTGNPVRFSSTHTTDHSRIPVAPGNRIIPKPQRAIRNLNMNFTRFFSVNLYRGLVFLFSLFL